MMRFLANRVLDAFAKRHDYDVAYMRMLLGASPSAFRKFGQVSALSGHREAVPVEASHAARLVGVLAEDCGPCTQLVADMARGEGVPDDQIIAVLSGSEAAMTKPVALAFRFARAMIENVPGLGDLREDVRRQWGDKGVVDLTFAAQMTRIYPMVKAGLGFAAACQQVKVGSADVSPKGKVSV